MIRDTKVVMALAFFGGLFYWIAVGELNRFDSGITFFRESWNGYLVALGLAAIFGVLANRLRWLAGALMVLPALLFSVSAAPMNVGAAVGSLFLPIIAPLYCAPASLIAEGVGRAAQVVLFFKRE